MTHPQSDLSAAQRAVGVIRNWAGNAGDPGEAEQRLHSLLAGTELPTRPAGRAGASNVMGAALLDMLLTSRDKADLHRRMHAWYAAHEGQIVDGYRIERVTRGGQAHWTFTAA